MPSLQLLFGPMLVGAFLNAILYGVLLVQTVIYFQAYKKDSTGLRLFVLYLFIAETINTGCDLGIIYEPLVSKYATPAATTFLPLLLPTDPLLTVLISTPIQVFVAYRIKIISRATWLAAVICVLAIIALGGGVWLSVTVVHVRRYSRKPELHWPALTWLLASAIADITITTSLAYNLARRKTGFSGTDDAINRIIRLTIQTGFVTAVFATLDVVCFLAVPHTTINFIWDFALSKLYTNALLSTLNARAGWNNLANGTRHNVLFGDGSHQTYTTASFRIAPATMATATYELETALPRTHKGQHNPEYGVAVTKEVDTVVDPPADSYRSTQ
ncbi:hypothetical protein LshimejAT787_0600560 [Lyophyllum shimeji]|uniref:DUF6534 domain-containing protein n=1 Tax=Lyophyllum shimeji TaxID=47721 RepID=A0A9P3PNZ2_LYOSH|nr:hypothetical protein LshimejAT787_0600560 [Lyophyllum shimeji]